MAVLPDDPFALNVNVTTEEEPGRTWFIDKRLNRIYGEVDGYAAARQAAEIILNVDRFMFQIYRPSSGTDYRNLVGQDAGYVAMELQRRIRDALSVDRRFTGIRDYTFTHNKDILSISFVITTVYGDIEEELEVPIA